MNGFDVFRQPVWRHLVFALLHTLWQGGMIALVLMFLLRRIPASRPGPRYLLAFAAQFGVLLTGLSTWAVLGYEPPRIEPEKVVDLGVRGAIPTAKRPDGMAGAPAAVDVSQAPVSVPSESGRTRWVPIVAVAWLTGVIVMLIRAVSSAVAALRLTRGPALSDPRILETMEGLKRDLGIRRAIRVVSADSNLGPAVLGLLWPTLVLPASMMTGLSPEVLRAILAHELAHIRRYDYAMNLVQMLLESLLFFNPAIWWLGRQARLEREACCDALAVRLTGRPLEYSRVLANWVEHAAEFSTAPAVALAWSGRGLPSPLLERVSRILRPGETPRLRVSWSGLIVLLLLAPLVLMGLRRGTTQAVALAAQILTPAERVEKLKEAQAKYAPQETVGQGKATLKGTIREPGGKPLSEPVQASAIGETARGGYGQSLNRLKESFSIDVHAGQVWLNIQPEKFAPVIVGPFTVKPGQTIAGIDVQLEPGFASRIRVVDEHNVPVSGVQVNFGLSVGGTSVYSNSNQATDSQGFVAVPHAARGTYSVSIKGPGFQTPEPRTLTFTPNGISTLGIEHARPAQGIIVAPDGAPVAGATLRPFAKYRPNMSYEYAPSEPIMATSAKDGRFRLDMLDSDASYTMLVESRQQGRRLVKEVRAGQDNLRWTIGPDLAIVGMIKGNLETLPKEQGKPIVRIIQHGKATPGGLDRRGVLFQSTVPVEPVDGGGRFRLAGILAGEVSVEAGAHVARVDVEHPETPVTVDLSVPPLQVKRRKVVFRVVSADPTILPTGRIEVHTTDTDPNALARILKESLKSGEVTFDLPVPGKAYCRPESVVGYWFKEEIFDVPPGDSPLVVEAKGIPAGAIVGRVLNADGTPNSGSVGLSLTTVEKPSSLENSSIQINNVRTDGEGRFFLGPLPFGGAYVAVAAQGHNKQMSKLVRLDGSKATEEVELRFTKPVAAGGRVLDPDGQPLAGAPVNLELVHPQAGTSWNPPVATDSNGRFRFDDLSSELGPYEVSLNYRQNYQPARATLNPGGPPIEIRLKRGHVITGRVVDAKTG